MATCEVCGREVLGHGTEVDGQFLCCAHCARGATDRSDIQDRSGS